MNPFDGFVITSDNTCDMPEEFYLAHDVRLLVLSYTVEGVRYGLGQNMDPKEFYRKMRGGEMPQTQQATPMQAEEFFEGFLKDGKSVLHISFSSALSGSYNSACLAAKELNEKYGEGAVRVVDSRCASMGEGLLLYYAVQMKEAGRSREEILSWLEENKLRLCHYFTVDDLNHLHRGGRVSKATAIIGSMLGIKPILHVDDEGRLIPIGKVRGRKQSLDALVGHMEKLTDGIENPVVFISHGDCEEDALYVREQVKKRLHIPDFMVNFIGPTIGTHSGPGTVALFFLGRNR